MARKRASMREGPLAELFRATEAAQRSQGEQAEAKQPPAEPEAAGETTASEAPTQLPLETEQSTPESAPPPVPRSPIELDATVEHVYEFELNRPTAAPVEAAAPGSPGQRARGRGARARAGRRAGVTRGASRVRAALARAGPGDRGSSRTRHPRAVSSRRCRRARRD